MELFHSTQSVKLFLRRPLVLAAAAHEKKSTYYCHKRCVGEVPWGLRLSSCLRLEGNARKHIYGFGNLFKMIDLWAVGGCGGVDGA